MITKEQVKRFVSTPSLTFLSRWLLVEDRGPDEGDRHDRLGHDVARGLRGLHEVDVRRSPLAWEEGLCG